MDVWIRKPTAEEKALLESQPTWEHDVERWDTVYDEREETCLVIEGKAYVELPDGTRYDFGVGDLVTFRPGLKCVWGVVEPIRKHYIFNMKHD